MTYQVTAECAHVTQDSPYGRTKVLVYKGAFIDDDAPELKHLIDSGMVEEVGKDASVGTNADGDLVPTGPTGGETPSSAGKKPAQSDPKADWVAFAVANGMDKGEAEKASKQDLIDALK